MTKRKLLLVVGAGASVEFGMPSVAGVRDIINAEIQKWYPLADRPSTNLYAHIESRVRRYWNRNVRPHLRRDPQFEDVLYTIFALAAAYPAGAYTSALGALIRARKLRDFTSFGGRRKTVDRNDLHHLGCSSVDALLREFREQCKLVERDKVAKVARLMSLMTALQTEFDVAVVTLNYDNVIYRSLRGIEVGFDPVTGRFEQDRIIARKDWPCMLHLHGSVHFDMRIDVRPGRHTDLLEIHWQPDINATFNQNSFGRSTSTYPEGVDFPTSVIVAGYGKTTQLMRRPFRTYYSELDRLVASCDSVLFAGYGFGDPHLNMAFEDFRDPRRRPVAIIGWANDDAMTVRGAGWDKYSTHIPTVLRRFDTEQHSMRWLGYSHPNTVEGLKREKEFEVSTNPDTPLSIWYNGMFAACDNPDKIVKQLR